MWGLGMVLLGLVCGGPVALCVDCTPGGGPASLDALQHHISAQLTDRLHKVRLRLGKRSSAVDRYIDGDLSGMLDRMSPLMPCMLVLPLVVPSRPLGRPSIQNVLRPARFRACHCTAPAAWRQWGQEPGSLLCWF